MKGGEEGEGGQGDKRDGHEVVEGDSGLEELDEGHAAEGEESGDGAAGLEDRGCAKEFVSYGAGCRRWCCPFWRR